jgi:hypothetical protein
MTLPYSPEELYVLQHILVAEGHGKTWAGFVSWHHQRAAFGLAERGVVVCSDDGREFLARRANGARIEGLG